MFGYAFNTHLSLVVNKVWVEETDIPNTYEISKGERGTDRYRCGKCEAMDEKCRVLVLPRSQSRVIL